MTSVKKGFEASKYPPDVRAIYWECIKGLRLQKEWFDNPGKVGAPPVSGKPYSAKDVKVIIRHVRSHCRSLARISRKKASPKKRVMMDKLILLSFPAHVSALLRAYSRRHVSISPQALFQSAKMSKQWHPLTEAIDARWVIKPKGGFRLIRSEGPARIARRLVIRDALQVMNIDSNIDYTKKGAGGERAFIKQVCNAIEGGHLWWWTPDIKNYFASLKPSHFKWLPLTRKLVKNDVFTPKCAKVKVTVNKDSKQIWLALKTQYPSHINDVDGLISFTVR